MDKNEQKGQNMFKQTHTKEETITKDQVKDQYIKVIFQDTGTSKTEVPGNVGIETQGLTDRHILMAAFLLLDTVYERFNQKGTTLAKYMFDTFDNSDKQEKAQTKNTFTIETFDEFLAKLKELNKKDNK